VERSSFKTPETAERCGRGLGGSTFVKRIVGLPGERVSELDGVIYINGEGLMEPYVDRSRRGRETASWQRIASDRYFVLGDNRMHSCDSRNWGTVPRGDLIGPVMLTYWPPSRGSFR
jgi:signal peptidase I